MADDPFKELREALAADWSPGADRRYTLAAENAAPALLAALDAAEARAREVEGERDRARKAAIEALAGKDTAWRAVWECCCELGLLSFIGGSGTGTGRVVAFIRHLAAQDTSDRDAAQARVRRLEEARATVRERVLQSVRTYEPNDVLDVIDEIAALADGADKETP